MQIQPAETHTPEGFRPEMDTMENASRHVPLMRMPFGTCIEVTCDDCRLCVPYTSNSLVKEARLGRQTIADLETILTCRRCAGQVAIRLVDEA